MSNLVSCAFEDSEDEEDEDYVPGVEDEIDEEYAEEELSDDPDKQISGSRVFIWCTFIGWRSSLIVILQQHVC